MVGKQGKPLSDIRFEVFKFYLGNFFFFNVDHQIIGQENDFFLIDISEKEMDTLPFIIPRETKSIRFSFGVDSSLQHQATFTGDLHPFNGMYWTWQAGYINCKIEGQITKQNGLEKFTFHLGGFLGKYKADQNVSIVADNEDGFHWFVDMKNLSKLVFQNPQKKIMRPSLDAVTLSQKIVQTFQ